MTMTASLHLRRTPLHRRTVFLIGVAVAVALAGALRSRIE
jgi:hypothetical protein